MMHQLGDSSKDEEIDVGILYQRHARAVLRYLNARLTIKEDAEDLLIEVFLASLHHPTLLKQNASEQLAWLYRVARNKLVDHYRHRNQQIDITASDDDLINMLMDEDAYRLPEQALLRREDRARLLAHIGTLNAIQQEVLKLRFAYGMHSAEIGKKLNKNAPTIRAILSRTLNKLRSRYEKQEEQH
jgi:RNA polymerase sigma factor (sigma-70 family)